MLCMRRRRRARGIEGLGAFRGCSLFSHERRALLYGSSMLYFPFVFLSSLVYL